MYRLGLGDALETELFWNKNLGSMFTNVGKTKKEKNKKIGKLDC